MKENKNVFRGKEGKMKYFQGNSSKIKERNERIVEIRSDCFHYLGVIICHKH